MATHSIAQRPHVVPFPQSVPKRDPHRNRPKMAFLTTNKIVAVLKAARERSTRDWAMILLAYRHGLRASEICGLRLADVDLKNFAVTIERLKGSLKTVQPLSEQRGQPLLDEVKALRAWLAERVEDGSGYLFLSRKGGALGRSQFFRTFQAITVSVGLPPEKRHGASRDKRRWCGARGNAVRST